MILGGFQKNTLIDFPGEVASLVFTQGCNFRCPYCHNPDLVPMGAHQNQDAISSWDAANKNRSSDVVDPEKTGHRVGAGGGIDEKKVFSFLERRKGLIDGVAVTGGEPTLQKDLDTFCFRLKNMGFKVKLDTNGSRPRVLASLLKRELLDYVAMDLKSDLNGYATLGGILFDPSSLTESIRLIIERAPAYEFRTTCAKPFVSQDTMEKMLNMIDGASTYVLQHYSGNGDVLTPDFFNGSDPACSEDDIIRFQGMAEQRGMTCAIR